MRTFAPRFAPTLKGPRVYVVRQGKSYSRTAMTCFFGVYQISAAFGRHVLFNATDPLVTTSVIWITLMRGTDTHNTSSPPCS
jgi:hypothetical protein